MKHQLWDWLDGPGRLGFVNLTDSFLHGTRQNSAGLNKKWWIFNNREVILHGPIHWSGPLSFRGVPNPRYVAIWSERLAKGPYQKNTPSSVGLEPAIPRKQIQAFTNWAILATFVGLNNSISISNCWRLKISALILTLSLAVLTL